MLKPGGHLISIAGPPDPGFADERGLNIVLKTVLRALSFGIRRASRKAGVHYSFLFMWADGSQLAQITSLVEQGFIKPVIDRIFPFAETPEALAYLERGSARGKIVVSMAGMRLWPTSFFSRRRAPEMVLDHHRGVAA